MVTKFSSKGQLVIPKPMRETLGISNGMRFHVTIEGKKLSFLLYPLLLILSTGNILETIFFLNWKRNILAR
jgi:AbrB family looped-hinge helix DNA binding protein